MSVAYVFTLLAKFGIPRRFYEPSFSSRWILCLLLSFLSTTCCTSNADEKIAFVLNGSFDDVFVGKHLIGGLFTVEACGSNALVDMTFENGYHQISGTDGRDTFTYWPPVDREPPLTPLPGSATISYGRFPTNAHFFTQILWLASVNDPELLTNLSTFSFPFYGDYNPGEMVPQIKTSGTPPDWVTSIQWYAPGYAHGGGTNRYRFSMYPNGWLVAEVSVTATNLVGGMALPTKIIFTQYTQHFVTNALQLKNKELSHIRPPGDVLPVEVVVFSVSNSQPSQALSSYVPEFLDKTAIVDDKRVGGHFRSLSGKWWTVGKLGEAKDKPVERSYSLLLIFLALFSFCAICVALKMLLIDKRKG
jgi:hypothetical protein